jgi:hypothetical protein
VRLGKGREDLVDFIQKLAKGFRIGGARVADLLG